MPVLGQFWLSDRKILILTTNDLGSTDALIFDLLDQVHSKAHELSDKIHIN
jgi:hypothetical protein